MRVSPVPRSVLWCVFAFTTFSACSLSFETHKRPDSLVRADRAFAQKKWARARRFYERFLRTAAGGRTAQTRQAVERAVTCSLKLNDPDVALKQAEKFRKTDTSRDPSKEKGFDAVPWEAQQQRWQTCWKAELENSEFCRRLLKRIDRETAGAKVKFRKRLAEARMRGNLQLVAWLDPEASHSPAPLFAADGNRWWWNGIPEADRYFRRAERRQGFWYGSEPIPLDKDGKPLLLKPPVTYGTARSRGEKVLFLLDEVRRLDKTTKKEFAAQAQLVQFQLAERFFGPANDSNWYRSSLGQFSSDRSWFFSSDEQQSGKIKAKPFHKLGDHEARLLISGHARVITLPADKSPLALLQRIETDYPASRLVPRAIYRQGAYCQSRRQFDKAKRHYRRLIKRFPKHPWSKAAKLQISAIDSPSIELARTGVIAAGHKPRIDFACRLAGEVRFTARSFDLLRFFKQRTRLDWWQQLPDLDDVTIEDLFPAPPAIEKPDKSQRKKKVPYWKQFVGRKVASWEQRVPKSPFVARHSTRAPLTKPGVYLVEASVAGQRSRSLVVVTGVAAVWKEIPGGQTRLWIVDARTGEPLPKQSVAVFTKADDKWVEKSRTTNVDGVLRLTIDPSTESFFAIDAGTRGVTFSVGLNEMLFGGEEKASRPVTRAVTDRPLYRPGDTVHFRLWSRTLKDNVYRLPKPGTPLHITIDDEQGETVAALNLRTDRNGEAVGSFRLHPEAALGQYSIGVHEDKGRWLPGTFRVEEYKKPEFEVTVEAGTTPHRLGEPFTARVKARYYFGRPVAGAILTYRVFRLPRIVKTALPHRFDWLYGNGFGMRSQTLGEYGDYASTLLDAQTYGVSAGDFGLEEAVATGTSRLDEKGLAEIRIPTKFLPKSEFDNVAESWKSDYTYYIAAEVRDESRRTVTGSGRVHVARRQFSTWIEPDRNWYGAGDTARMRIAARTANGRPIETRGKLTLYRLTRNPGEHAAHEPAPAEIETKITSWKLATDARGELIHRVHFPKPGRYRIAFATRDGWKEELRTTVDIWVYGPGTDASKLQLPDFELIPDRRTYRVGDTARVLVVTAHSSARVLFDNSHNREYELAHVRGPLAVREFRIEDRHVAKVNLSGMFVQAGMVHHAEADLFVPPARRLLKVRLTPDRKSACKPGVKARVQVRVTDAAGRPVTGNVTLAVYDKSLDYFALPDDGDGLKSFLSELIPMRDSPHVGFTMNRALFDSTGTVRAPEYMADWYGDAEKLTEGELRVVHEEIAAIARIRGMERHAQHEARLQSIHGPLGGFGGGSFGDRTVGLAPGFGGLGGIGGYVGDLNVSFTIRGGYRAALSGTVKSAVAPVLRSDFRDRAIWFPAVRLDKSGRGIAEITLPDSLTTWRTRAWVVTPQTHVGEAAVEIVTAKDLLVRLQSPRFVVERDRVTLSANVNNNLKTVKAVTAELSVPAALFRYDGKGAEGVAVERDGRLVLTARATVPANGRHRFDWPLRVHGEGTARVTVKALTDEESDAVQMTFPVIPRGIAERFAQSASMRSGEVPIRFTLPRDLDPKKTRIELSLAPSPSAVMLDAIPYLARYPYGCVEQTMSRFYPLALARQSLKQLGTDLEALGKARRKVRRAGPGSPVYDSTLTQDMVEAGLQRLYRFQHEDGGWGWWQNDASTPYMTAYVLLGLQAAADAGVKVRASVFARGLQYLQHRYPPRGTTQKPDRAGDLHAQALVAYVSTLKYPDLRENGCEPRPLLLNVLQESRSRLNTYGKTLLALALHNTGKHKRAARDLLAAILKTARRDERNETSWIPTASDSYRWRDDAIETNAWMLRALLAIDPKNERIAQFARWLARNRRGRRWDSTRSTALAVSALAEHVKIAGKTTAASDVDVCVDGRKVRTTRVTWDDTLKDRNRLVVPAGELKPGKHTLTLVARGKADVYYSLTVDWFRKPKRIPVSGKGIAVKRRYYRVPPEPNGKAVLLSSGDTVKVGDVVEVRLKISADSDYEYLAFEDPRPAGCEPVQLRSGSRWEDDFFNNVELRDRRVVFFAERIPRGEQVVRYRLRAETPGDFRVLPTHGFAMYAPDIRAHSHEMRLRIVD